VIDDAELLRRSVIGFGEWIAALADGHAGPGDVIRRDDALGARLRAAADNPWFSAVVVPPGAMPPADAPGLPTCVWTVERSVPGRVERAAYAMPCMGIGLDGLGGLDAPAVRDARDRLEPVPRDAFASLNELAYGDGGERWFAPFLATLRDPRVRLHGLRGEDGAFATVLLTIEVGDDVGINFTTTAAAARGRGLAARLALAVLADARDRGLRTTSLQSTGDGLPLWRGLGLREVGTVRAFLRPHERAPRAD
jgi:GNAT superfamily N-acetyltransferase